MMRIDNSFPVFNPPFSETAGINRQIPESPVQANAFSLWLNVERDRPRQGVIVDISPEAQAAYKATENATQKIDALEPKECETCKNRKYKDVSNDPSVSFQTPTHMGPGQSASGVMAHENEHVSHEQAKAARNDRRVISQSVTLSSAICPECGTIYISGGVTRTVTAADNSNTGSLVDEIA